MKTCKKCNEKKPLSSFYVHKKMADGHLNICKDCTKARVSKHRELNIDYIREYDKKRAKLQHRIKLKAKLTKKYRADYPERYYAHMVFRNAVRDGKVEKMPCFICGNKQVEGHHPDYSRPLDVVWLCTKHHVETHKLTKNHV